MRKIYLSLFFLGLGLSLAASAAVEVGQKAPGFELKNEKGERVSLKSFEGKKVVLEWYNQDCPFVRKFYDAKKMQELQADAKENNIVWLTIASSAPGKQGHLDQSSAMERRKVEGAQSTHILLDPKGEVGMAYAAKTTPHMFILSESQVVLYDGAIDDIPSANGSDIEKADNYIELAMNDLEEGNKVKVAKTKPYGCSVKYP